MLIGLLYLLPPIKKFAAAHFIVLFNFYYVGSANTASAHPDQKELLILSLPYVLKMTVASMLLATLTGCANHLPVETVNSMDMDRESLHQDSVIQPQGAHQGFIDNPTPIFNATSHESFQVTSYSVNKTLEVYTPYQPLRELYEFPAGIIMTTGGVVLSIADVLPFFGMLPDAITTDLLANGVAGINPFMNMESQARSEKKVLGTPEREVIDQKTEQSDLPLRKLALTAAVDGQFASLMTDDRGQVTVDLVSLVDETKTPTLLTLSMTNDSGAEIHKEFPLTRQLSVRLLQAKRLIDKYQHVDGNKLKLDDAVTDLSNLSRWGFEDHERLLEQRIRQQLNNEQRIAFDRQLTQAFAG